ncbi:cupin domain-containing protein [Arcticibacter sp.]|jgi:quercetin dioxygenase-like cupin family protein|uniref:cupin domain-containing protein n=1 Tax=Arcticibacter sp. TaxID=1872630 RepID=UPI00388F9FC1
MEEKRNESTSLRPEGERLLDAKLVRIDLSDLNEQIQREKAWLEGDRTAITVFKTDDLRIVMIALHAGAEMKPHTAPGVISVQVLKGKINFATDDHHEDLKPGQMITLHKRVPHHVKAYEDSSFLLTMATPGGID